MERVNTGGSIAFEYSKGHNPELTEEGKYGVREAYRKANERKKRERKKKRIITASVLLIILSLIVIKYFY